VVKTLFISILIPYMNARVHIGHALEVAQADAIARFHRAVKQFLIIGRILCDRAICDRWRRLSGVGQIEAGRNR